MSRKNLVMTSLTNNVIGTCPCLGFVDGIPVCLNGGSLEEVELFNIHPDLVQSLSGARAEISENDMPQCFGCVHADGAGLIRCASKGSQIVIRGHELTLNDLEIALENFPRDRFSSDTDICNECLYKVLISLLFAL